MYFEIDKNGYPILDLNIHISLLQQLMYIHVYLRHFQFVLQVIFNSGVWVASTLSDGDDDDLKDLADELPGVILDSRANSTVRQYSGAFMKWCKWADKYGKQRIPANSFYVSLYLISLSHSANSPAPIIKAIAAISWAHKLAGSDDPGLSHMVRSTVEGLKRKLASPCVKKEPITADIMHKLVDFHCKDISVKNLLNVRTVTMCLVAFAGFLRFDELAKIKRGHISFCNSHISIVIPSSKTDQLRQGQSVVVARLQSKYCPVNMLEKYISLAQVHDKDAFIFRSLSATKLGYKLRDDNRPMGYTRVREVVIDALKPIVCDVSKYCIHSLRAGGASEAASAGVPDRLFKRHGRWKSETAKDGYIKENFSNLLSVSQSLGLGK